MVRFEVHGKSDTKLSANVYEVGNVVRVYVYDETGDSIIIDLEDVKCQDQKTDTD